MTTDPSTTRYRQLLDALVRDHTEETTPLLLLCATSLARWWELLHPETVLDRGVLHLPGTAANGLVMPARSFELPGTLTQGLCDVRGTLYDLLGLPAGRYGQLVQLHREAVAELEVPFEMTLDGILRLHLQALLAAATTPQQVQAVFACAGIPRNTKREHVLRAGGLADEIAWVTDTTDRFLTGDAYPVAQAN